MATDNALLPPICRVGIEHFPSDATTAATLTDCARLALHHAKETERGDTLFYSADMQQQEQHRLALKVALHDAIALKRLLRRDDYLIFTAHSGLEGLHILKNQSG